MKWLAEHVIEILIVGSCLCIGLVLVATLVAVVEIVDSTNSTDYTQDARSGLRLHIDAAHGCHYLSTFFGSPTPRLDAEGEHVCTGREP